MRVFLTVLWLLLMIIFLGYCYISYDNLPEKMAVHFNANGQPDGWGSKAGFFKLFIGIILGVNLMFVFFYTCIKKIPVSILNLPWKDYWFKDEEQKKIAYNKLKETMAGSGVFFNAMFLAVIYMTVQVNMNKQNSFSIFLQDNLLWLSILGVVMFVTSLICNFIPRKNN